MTRKINGTKPEHDLHTWSEERTKIEPKRLCLTRSLTRSLTRKTIGTKPEHDQHKMHKKDIQTLLRPVGLTRSSGRFVHSVKMFSAYGRHFLENSFDLIFALLFTGLKTSFTAFTKLSALLLTACGLSCYLITSKIITL